MSFCSLVGLFCSLVGLFCSGGQATRAEESSRGVSRGSHTRRGGLSSVRRPTRGLAVPSIPSILTISNTIMESAEESAAAQDRQSAFSSIEKIPLSRVRSLSSLTHT
jgi:hypothetical protein